MEVGIYLGRHQKNLSGLGVYVRSLLLEMLELLEEDTYKEFKLTLYGGRDILKEDFLKKIKARGNGKVKIVELKTFFSYKINILYDIFWFSFLFPFKKNNISLIHSLCNLSFVRTKGIKNVLTLHDLYQAYPPKLSLKKEKSRLKKKIISLFYRYLFFKQFSSKLYVLLDSKSVEDEVKIRYSLSSLKLKVIELGVDDVFRNYMLLKSKNAHLKKEEDFLRKYNLESDFTLLLASNSARKNLRRQLEAYFLLEDEFKTRPLVVLCDGKDSKRAVKEYFREKGDKLNISYLLNLKREDMPVLFSASSVVINATLAEGYGLPAIEALFLGSSIVTSELSSLKGVSSSLINYCNPYSVSSIKNAIKGSFREGKKSIKPPKLRTMKDVSLDVLDFYKKIMLDEQ